MSKPSPQPQPTPDRLRRTLRLMAVGESDTARWAHPASLADQWDERAARAARHIPAGSHVLDLGAGAMALRRFLDTSYRYTAADVVCRGPGCRVVDLNRREFPAGAYDWVVLLGVLEYLHDCRWVLARAARAADSLIASYCLDTAGDVAKRRAMGWVNDYTETGFDALLAAGGWRRLAVETLKTAPSNLQRLFVCTRADAEEP
jgi:hypothetical protein